MTPVLQSFTLECTFGSPYRPGPRTKAFGAILDCALSQCPNTLHSGSSIYRWPLPRRIALNAKVYSPLTCDVKWSVVVRTLLNQSWQHIADARIRSQAQGRFLTFRSVGYNIGCRSPLSNCNQCAHIDFSSCHPLVRTSFQFHCSEIVLVTCSSLRSDG
jgi:hypothetical protein